MRLLVTLALAVALASCGRAPQRAERTSPTPEFSEPVPRDSEADDVGRFLAGLPGREGSPFRVLEGRDVWDVHRRELGALWQRVEGHWIPAMRRFQKEELSGPPIRRSPLFYPFSGPDVMMATVFFPSSPVYLMVGLEPTGTIPPLRRLTEEDLPVYLQEVRGSISSLLERSFFITREMDEEFRGKVTDGLLPPILLLLTRTGHTVLGHRYVRLDERGRILERAADYKAPGRIGNKGAEIDFRTDADQSLHKLFYFSVNLSDARLRENLPFQALLGRLEGMTTFLKATSYLPHNPEFSIIRERILGASSSVLQDDSGVPYRFFDSALWQVQLYGSYTVPYGSFGWREQPDLRKAYELSGAKPLSFHIGYGFARIPSNLLLARRKPIGAPAGAAK